MSSEELLVAYSEGLITRRALMRRLVAGGVTIGAAATYAHVLAPQARGESEQLIRAEYPSASLKILSGRRKPIVKSEKFKVKVRTDRAGTYKVEVAVAGKRVYKKVGSKTVKLKANKSKRVAVKIKKKKFKGKGSVDVYASLLYKFPKPMGFRATAADHATIT